MRCGHTSSVSAAVLSWSEDLVVALDYGQFYLHTDEEDPELAVDLLDVAQASDGIAQRAGLVVVVSPHQNNFAMPLRIEVWTAEPDGDLDEWEEAFETHIDVGDEGLTYESPTLDLTPIAVPPGSYHALITGRGFVAHGWPGSTEPGDSWRIRVWPSPGPSRARRLRTSGTDESPDSAQQKADSTLEEPQPPNSSIFTEDGEERRREQATEAALRVAADLDHAPGARELSGTVGHALLDVVLPRKISAVWPLFADLDITSMSAPNERAVGNEFAMQKSYRDKDAFAGNTGGIVCRWTELAEPTQVAMTWQWVEGLIPGTPRLPHQAHLRMALTELNDDDEHPRTRVVLTHSDIPIEWIDDMTTIWESKFDQWAYQSKPHKKRRR
jgi:hypothetical protein